MSDALNLLLLAALLAIPARGLYVTTRWASRPARHAPTLRRILMMMPTAGYAAWAVTLVAGTAIVPDSRLWLLELGFAVTLWLAWSVAVSLGLTVFLLVRYHTDRP